MKERTAREISDAEQQPSRLQKVEKPLRNFAGRERLAAHEFHAIMDL